jgi:serine/threonine protein kinase
MSSLPECSEYLSIINNSNLYKSSKLKGGHVIKQDGTIVRYVGGYCVVFPFETLKGKCAVRCWHASLKDMQRKTKLISEHLSSLKLPYFVNFEYETEGLSTTKGIQPIVIMDWVEATSFKDYLRNNLHESSKINQLAEDFFEMTRQFHQLNISHGDLQHGNIMIREDGSLVLVDYDSMYVPTLEGYEEEIKGLEGYQSEARWGNKYLTPKADYFSEMVIYTSLKALSVVPELWDKLRMEDTETMLFSKEDIKSKGCSAIFKELESQATLAPCISSIRNAMRESDINDIIPLEKSLYPNEAIKKKWGEDRNFTIYTDKS